MNTDDLRFPVGRFEAPAAVTAFQVAAWIDEIAALPAGLNAAVRPLTPAQLETPYREELWAELKDCTDVPVEASLRFIELLHERWVTLLRGLGPADLQRDFVHPDSGIVGLDVNIGIYAWHGRHHLAHIPRLAEREGWTR